MDLGDWLANNWFVLLQSVGIIASLLFTAFTIRKETVARRLTDLLTLTENHREIWKQLYDRPELARVTSLVVDLRRKPPTRDEELFVTLLILHLGTARRAMRHQLVEALGGVRDDVRWFFSLPLPRAIWEKVKPFQEKDLVLFVEECRKAV